MVAGIGPVEGVECVIGGADPTVKGGTSNPHTWRKALRMMEVAEQNRMPMVQLVESGGADLRTQAEGFIPGGETFRNITRLSSLGIPTLALVFGNSTAGGAYLPGMSDYNIFVRERAKVFLGGPPLVKMATGEVSEDEELGGADMHARVSGLAEYLANDEYDALRLGREVVRRLNWRKHGYGPTEAPDPPVHDPDDLLGIVPPDLKAPFDPREVIARVVDGSRYDEFKALYGPSLTTGWASIHGYPVGIIANVQGVLFSAEAQKASQFIQLANQKDVPLVFMHNTTGYMVGKDYEQGGIIKHGAQMINAVSNSKVPHLGVIMAASYGAGNYGMSGRAYDPRFLFSWPSRAVRGHGPAAAGRRAVDRGPRLRRGQGRGVRRGRRQGHARDGRGPDRVRADGAGQQLARLRRRHHRPARHAHRAGHGAERRAQPRGQGRRGLRRLPDVSDARPRVLRSPTEARSPAASSAPAAGWASAPSPCTPRPTPRRCSCARPTARWPSAAPPRPTPTCAATRWCRPRWTRAPTPSTPATASWPRTRRSRARCPTPG